MRFLDFTGASVARTKRSGRVAVWTRVPVLIGAVIAGISIRANDMAPEVMADMSRITHSYPAEGEVVDEANGFGVFFSQEVSEVSTTKTTYLYREGSCIRQYDIFCGLVDWGHGKAIVKFGEDVQFEDGIRYSWVIPENTIRSSYTNEVYPEIRYNFIGGYTNYVKPIAPIEIEVSYSASNSGYLQAILTYDEPIGYVGSYPGFLPICRNEDNSLIQEAPQTIEKEEIENGTSIWKLKSEFYPIETLKEAYLEIPQTTIVSMRGAVRVNEALRIPLGNVSSIQELSAQSEKEECFSPTGLRLTSPMPGLNIRRKNGEVRKIVIRAH